MSLIGTDLLEFSHELATFMDLDSIYRIWWPHDERIMELLGVDGQEEAAVYTLAVGKT
jgi:hypothetical protein